MDLETLLFENAEAWERWLEANHETSPGIWMKIVKKGSAHTSPSYAEALDAALCYGWIDGQKRALDQDFYLQRFTPRRKKSIWSQVNVEKVAALEASGRMREAGRREVERAKADGRWEAAYASQSKMTVPEDLQQALDAEPAAAALFATLKSANRYAILFRVTTAKKPETRAKRIKELVAMLARGETLH